MVRVRIKVKPGARQDAVMPESSSDADLVVTVRAAAEGGKANRAVCEVLAKWADVPKTSVSVVRGHTARIKTVEFASLDEPPFG